jgi:Ankyrin repeats (3 copies)
MGAAASSEFGLRRSLTASEESRSERMTDFGVVLATGSILFTARIVCEQTLLAWTRGAPMTESPAPQFVLDWIGLSFVILAALWAAAIVILSAHERSGISSVNRWLIALALLCCGLWLIPAMEWRLMVLRVHGTERVPKSWVVGAAGSGEIRLLDYLLANGADASTRTSAGESALGAAAAADQTAAAALLIARGARLENRTRITFETPLTEAAKMNHLDMVRLLLDHGADIDAKDVTGRTALDWAHENSNTGMEQLILSRSVK